MAELSDKWARNNAPGIAERVGDAVHPPKPLRPRLNSGIKTIRRQRNALDRMLSKLESRDKTLLGKVVAAKGRGDAYAAKALAGELAQLRHVKKVMMMAGLALDKVEIRLSMDVDVGDAVAAIAPTIPLMRKLGTTMGSFIPEADAEINQMAETLGGFMSNTLYEDSFSVDQSTGEEVDTIMQEAAAVVTQSVDSKFPSTPESLGESQQDRAATDHF